MKPFINISVDVEQDMPPFRNSYKGIKEGIPKILDILDNYDIRATFFITGKVCNKFPEVVKEISKKHEIASHSWDHTPLKKMNLVQQYTNIKNSKELLEKVIKRKIMGFRAPEHIITKETLSLLEILNFKYDSSALFHIWYPRKYNFLRYPPRIYHPDYKNPRKEGDMKIVEIPASSYRNMVINMFYLRLLGKKIINYADKVYNKNNFLMFYLHPWELVELKKRRSGLLLYKNLGKKALEKFELFLERFEGKTFLKIEEVI